MKFVSPLKTIRKSPERKNRRHGKRAPYRRQARLKRAESYYAPETSPVGGPTSSFANTLPTVVERSTV